MLKADGIDVRYGAIRAVKTVSFDICAGEIVAVVGPNGAGKTSLLRALSGLHPVASGRVRFLDQDITNREPHRIVQLGLVQVLQGRQVFGEMTVLQNLRMGAYRFAKAKKAEIARDLDAVYSYFPVLGQRSRQLGGTLSGGEQVMLAIGRALMAKPKLLLLDEPSFGLAPMMVEVVLQALLRLKADGVTVVLVEQNAELAFALASRAYLMVLGRMAIEGPCETLRHSPEVIDLYLGRSR